MLQEVVDLTKKAIENSISENEDLYGTKIDYILINPENNDTISIISDGEEKIVEFTPYTKEMKTGYASIAEWAYNFDEYLFQELEKSYQIGYMSDDSHYNIWNYIDELYPEDITKKDGVQWYLQYCADNGITKEYLDKKLGLDTPDVMKHFKGLTLYETMEYKGYIIEADYPNLDNAKENLVNIYENEEDYKNKEPIETVSLNAIDLKNNIKKYINDIYLDNDKIVDEKNYFAFVIGYDFLQEEFKTSPAPECDLTYGFCMKVADNFINSDYYKCNNHSSYEMLAEYINDNKFEILKDYEKFIGTENIYFEDNKKILEVGMRKDQPVALVERTKNNKEKEYIVAFYYKMEDNKLSWGYAHYYDDNKTKAKQDFKKAVNGENLAHTFDKEQDGASL